MDARKEVPARACLSFLGGGEFAEQGQAQGDVRGLDKGTSTVLGEGLLVLRRAFEGALTNKSRVGGDLSSPIFRTCSGAHLRGQAWRKRPIAFIKGE